MEKIRIICLTYGELDFLAKEALSEIDDDLLEITIINGVGENLSEQVDAIINDGYDVIVAGGNNATYAKKCLKLPVVEIFVSPYNFVQAIQKAKYIGSKIGVTSINKDAKYDFRSIAETIDIPIEVIKYDDSSELEYKIRSSNVDVLIGTAHAVELAITHGKKGVLIYPGKDTIIEAIHEARKLVQEMRKEQKKSGLLQALIKFIPNGIIVIDIMGIVIEFNNAAENLFNIKRMDAMGKDISDLFPESTLPLALTDSFEGKSNLNKYKDMLLLEKHIQIVENGKIVCVVSIISEMSDVKKAEYEYRIKKEKKNALKGFSARYKFSNIIGHSKVIKKTIELAKVYSQSDANVLLIGDTGTGKEVFAQSLHNHSDRKNGPFIAINCAALPENLLESELFGYEEGAFTGSKKGGKVGMFELADKGSIFLDEIGELSTVMQARLLRVIQEKEILRIGGEKLEKIDVRIISATNKDISVLGEKVFRNDLLYRLNVLELRIPMLAERESDVIELFYSFLKQKLNFYEHDTILSESAQKILIDYTWPGNIRELLNVCERFSLFIRTSNKIDKKMIKKLIVESIGLEKLFCDMIKRTGHKTFSEITDTAEAKELIKSLKDTLPWTNEQLSAKLDISRTTMWRLEK